MSEIIYMISDSGVEKSEGVGGGGGGGGGRGAADPPLLHQRYYFNFIRNQAKPIFWLNNLVVNNSSKPKHS